MSALDEVAKLLGAATDRTADRATRLCYLAEARVRLGQASEQAAQLARILAALETELARVAA